MTIEMSSEELPKVAPESGTEYLSDIDPGGVVRDASRRFSPDKEAPIAKTPEETASHYRPQESIKALIRGKDMDFEVEIDPKKKVPRNLRELQLQEGMEFLTRAAAATEAAKNDTQDPAKKEGLEGLSQNLVGAMGWVAGKTGAHKGKLLNTLGAGVFAATVAACGGEIETKVPQPTDTSETQPKVTQVSTPTEVAPTAEPTATPEVPLEEKDLLSYLEGVTSPDKENAEIGVVDNTKSNEWFGFEFSRGISLTGPFEIRTKLEYAEGPEDGWVSITLHGRFAKEGGEWWEGVHMLYLRTSPEAVHLGLRDGVTEDSFQEIELPGVKNGDELKFEFGDEKGKTISIFDSQGNLVKEIDLTTLEELDFPDGLFPDEVLYPGVLLTPGAKLEIELFKLMAEEIREHEEFGREVAVVPDYSVDTPKEIYEQLREEQITRLHFEKTGEPVPFGIIEQWTSGTEKSRQVFISGIVRGFQLAQSETGLVGYLMIEVPLDTGGSQYLILTSPHVDYTNLNRLYLIPETGLIPPDDQFSGFQYFRRDPMPFTELNQALAKEELIGTQIIVGLTSYVKPEGMSAEAEEIRNEVMEKVVKNLKEGKLIEGIEGGRFLVQAITLPEDIFQ